MGPGTADVRLQAIRDFRFYNRINHAINAGGDAAFGTFINSIPTLVLLYNKPGTTEEQKNFILSIALPAYAVLLTCTGLSLYGLGRVRHEQLTAVAEFERADPGRQLTNQIEDVPLRSMLQTTLTGLSVFGVFTTLNFALNPHLPTALSSPEAIVVAALLTGVLGMGNLTSHIHFNLCLNYLQRQIAIQGGEQQPLLA